jgi:hypothetical protein
METHLLSGLLRFKSPIIMVINIIRVVINIIRVVITLIPAFTMILIWRVTIKEY